MKKKFRFPKGIKRVIIPEMAPIELELIALNAMTKVRGEYKEFPKKAHFGFSYSGGRVMNVEIFK